ncbi:AraC family transcriptional regulator [Paucibacter sp. B2R-40]|uniref:AraC family transcriptional regulator n=1 Tax=Paucibacter sp. B2R-40 TaxID=2893554 RepID=UPI0021E47EF0|nr:AraC family transcriptional regulator [Paucibacter sp. B2R-40]MCV2352947.1 AraC family transcriptional regulator [Paucibacter sp. B2R-40]
MPKLTRQRDGVSSGLLLPLHQTLLLRGLDGDALLRRANISPQQLLDQRSRISQRDSIQFWRLAEAACEHDPGLAVEIAGQFNLRALGLLGMAWLASTSLREATRRLVRYYDLVSSIAVLRVQQEGELVWLQYHASPGVLALTHDTWAGVVGAMCRSAYAGASGQAFTPTAVRLAHGRNAGTALLAASLGCAVEVDATCTAVAFTASQLDAPLPGGHPGMALSAEKILAATLAELNSGATHHRVRAHLLTMLPSGHISRAAVAERMHMTERTLQRRLEVEQFGFAELLQQTRLELAQNLLRDPEHDVQDVAFILGFAEISSFTRAFRRWTGQAPSAWREHLH